MAPAHKALYAGIPGISDAVLKSIKLHYDKSKALDQMGRRVEEQVLFGDSAAALELLRGFEADEEKLAGEVKAEFKAAMKTLLGSKTKATKQLGAKK